MRQERLPFFPAIVVPPGRMQLCSGTLITVPSFMLRALLSGGMAETACWGGEGGGGGGWWLVVVVVCVYLKSQQFFMAYLCHSLRPALLQVEFIASVAGVRLRWWHRFVSSSALALLQACGKLQMVTETPLLFSFPCVCISLFHSIDVFGAFLQFAYICSFLQITESTSECVCEHLKNMKCIL